MSACPVFLQHVFKVNDELSGITKCNALTIQMLFYGSKRYFLNQTIQYDDNDNDNDLFYYSDLCYNDFVTSSIN